MCSSTLEMRDGEDGTFLLKRSLRGFSVSSLLTLGFQLPFIFTVLQIQDKSEGVIYILGFTYRYSTILY